MNPIGRAFLILGAATALALASAAYAQSTNAVQSAAVAPGSDELEEVTVTAERRTEDEQKTAASVTVRSGDELRQEGRDSLSQVLEDVPGVTVNGAINGLGGSGSDNQGGGIIIRGTVPNGGSPGSTISGVPATAVYTDGVYEGIGSNYDLDRVEVLRGPQGTLYGRSATSGVAASYTRNPVLNSFGVDVSEEVGSYALTHEQGAVNVPLGDTFAFRASGNEIERNGFFSAQGGKSETTEGRAKLLFEPSSDFSLLVGAALQYNHTNSGGVQITQPTPTTYAFTPIPFFPGKNHFNQYWANLSWNLGPATLTYLPALRQWHQDAVTAFETPFGLFYQTELRPLDQFVTQELHLASNPGSKLTWQLGSLYYDNRLNDIDNVVVLGKGLVQASLTRKETEDWGMFGEATYPFTDTLRLTAGLRYDYTYVQTDETFTANAIPGLLPEHDTTLTIGGAPGTFRFYNHTYKLRLETDVTPANLLYANVSTGFLPGDVSLNTTPNLTPGAPPGSLVVGVYPYKEETLTAYEIGSKNRFLNNSLQLNGDVYYYNYGGYQEFINIGLGPVPSFVTVSVPAKMRGLELEALYRLTSDDRIALNYAYIHAEFVNAPALFTQFTVQSRITGIAPVTGSASYDHTFHLPGGSTLDFRGDARYSSSHDLNTITPTQYAAGFLPDIVVAGEWVGDLSLTWLSEGGKYSATGYVRNVGDNKYKAAANAPGLGNPATATPYDPRTLGVVLRARF